jgi:hypothetical protein
VLLCQMVGAHLGTTAYQLHKSSRRFSGNKHAAASTRGRRLSSSCCARPKGPSAGALLRCFPPLHRVRQPPCGAARAAAAAIDCRWVSCLLAAVRLCYYQTRGAVLSYAAQSQAPNKILKQLGNLEIWCATSLFFGAQLDISSGLGGYDTRITSGLGPEGKELRL